MKFEIKNRWSAEVMFSIEGETFALAFEAAIRAGLSFKNANLESANLESANLKFANLESANLKFANLEFANLEFANLKFANLESANLKFANLEFANLKFANLESANLESVNLKFANLESANLESANLESVNLEFANLEFANLKFANLESANLESANLESANLKFANLKFANLESVRNDFWAVLLFAQNEVPALRKALVEGLVDGSVYRGECACLVGTIANAKRCDVDLLPNQIQPNAGRPAERFFLSIRRGHTPENCGFAKLAVEWIDTWTKQHELAVSK